MVSNVNTILRQYLHVEVNGSESDGLVLQRSLPSLFQHWLTPAIERTLERYAPPVGHLHIERLEIDIGTMKLEQLEHDLAKAVAEALEKSLRDQVPSGEPLPDIVSDNVQYKTAQHSIGEAFLHFLTTGSLPWSFRLPEGMTLEQVMLGSWQEAAKSGINPHAVNDAVLGVLASASVRKRLIRQFSPAFLSALLSRLSSEGGKIMGEVLQLLRGSDESRADTKPLEQQLWEKVFAKVGAGEVFSSTDLVGDAWRGRPPTAAGDAVPANMLERYRSTMIKKTSATANRFAGTAPEPSSYIEQEGQSHAKPGLSGNVEPGKTQGRIEAEPQRRVEPIPLSHTETEPQCQPVIRPSRFAEREPQRHVEPGLTSNAEPITQCKGKPTPSRRFGPGRQGHKEPAASHVEPEPQRHTGPGLNNRAGTRPSRHAAQGPQNLVQSLSANDVEAGPQNHVVHHNAQTNIGRHPEAGVGIFIENAGMVLVHPFLPRFFEALDIAADDKLLQPERALCLLHFLTTGRLIAPEYDLVLPKILCNVPLLTPVDSNVILTATEQEEGIALLQAVIRHWEALGNTSPDGLRGTFLLRPGKVSLRDDGDWLLQVEAKSCDILLDSLPWGISMTNLPWMESMLWVEWR